MYWPEGYSTAGNFAQIVSNEHNFLLWVGNTGLCEYGQNFEYSYYSRRRIDFFESFLIPLPPQEKKKSTWSVYVRGNFFLVGNFKH